MGNMGNPLINRWGVNLFWYNFWFVDKNYHLLIKQDTILSKLIYIFLNYGILLPKNIFTNKYWFYRKFDFKNYFNYHNTKYFRIVNFKNATTNVSSFYFNRMKLKNIYQGKLWILRYQNWLIINYYCFRPVTGKILKKTIPDSDLFKKGAYLNPAFSNKIEFDRLFFFFFFMQNRQINANYYNF